jgi:serine/threonine protein kinase
MTLASGTVLAGYVVDRLLGRGGMGEVYLATHEGLGRKVALKLLSDEVATGPTFRERFIAESRLAASLDHPHIVPIYEAGEADGRLFIAMRYVPGVDLATLVQRERRLTPERAVGLLRGIAQALDAAHEQGLIHRDVKPENVLVGNPAGGEHAYLADFGLTKQLGSDAAFTRSNQMLGSVGYMAPEQIEGRPVDGRADEYSLACVLYECLTGQAPFGGGMASLWAHVNQPRPRPSEIAPDLAPFDDVIAKGMAIDPAERYASAGEMLAGAEAASTGEGVDATRRRSAGRASSLVPDNLPAQLFSPSRPTVPEPSLHAGTYEIPPRRLDSKRFPSRWAIQLASGALALAVIVLVAIFYRPGSPDLGSSNSSTTSRLESRLATELSTSALGVATLPRINARLSPGVYRTQLFSPTMTFVFGSGWRTSGDTPGAVGIGPQDDPEAEVVFVRIQTVYDGACPPSAVGIGPSPRDLIEALRQRDDLDVSEPLAVTYGGAIGLQVDLTPKTDSCGADDPPILLFQVAQGDRFAQPGRPSRLVALDIDGQTLAADIYAPDLDAFWERARAILESFNIDTTR